MLHRMLALVLTVAALLGSPGLVRIASAADHAAANETIWPSQNDVAQTAGDGKKLLENQWAKPIAVFSPNNYTLTGLTVPGSSASLNIDVALGTSYLAGRHVTIPGATTVTAAASSTNYVFAKLTRDGSNLVTGVSFEANTTGTAPADSTPVAILTAGASTITATTDKRILPTTAEVLTSGTSWTFPAGITRVYVEVLGASGGGGGGGEGYDSGNADSTNGAVGTAGGTTTFGALTANGGDAGGLGLGGGKFSGAAINASASAAHGSASGGAINFTGRGQRGGNGGLGGGPSSGGAPNGLPGGSGGDGGYAAGYVTGTVGSTVTYALGAAGNGGAGGGGLQGGDGSAGQGGQAGRIVIHY